jgi:hypothetical protein
MAQIQSPRENKTLQITNTQSKIFHNSFGNTQAMRKQEPTIDLKCRVNAHGWERNKNPYL